MGWQDAPLVSPPAATGDGKGQVTLWDISGLWAKKPGPEKKLRTLTGAEETVLALAFAPDGKTVAAVHKLGEDPKRDGFARFHEAMLARLHLQALDRSVVRVSHPAAGDPGADHIVLP